MGIFSRLSKISSQIFLFGTGIMEIIHLFITPFSSIAFCGFTWGQVISGIFIISVFWAIIQLNVENSNLTKRKPDIEVKPLFSSNCAILELKNKGGRDNNLVIQGKILQEIGQTNIYDIFRGSVNKGEPRSIKIAEIIKPNFFHNWHGFGEMTENDKRITEIMSLYFHDHRLAYVRYPSMSSINPSDDIIMEITLTTEKPMIKPFGKRIYCLKLNPDGLIDFNDYVLEPTSSRYSRLSALINFIKVSLNKYGLSRLLKRHSSSSR